MRSLLRPDDIETQYQNLITQTIAAYDAPHVLVGEMLQNALDAVAMANQANHTIQIEIDFDTQQVRVLDDGIGFPNNPNFLFLGGSGKPHGAGLYGQIGAGMKVVLFSSEHFVLRSRTDDGSVRFELGDAYRYAEDAPPELELPDDGFAEDPEPLAHTGTEVTYRFPEMEDSIFDDAWTRILDMALPDGDADPMLDTLGDATKKAEIPTRLAALMTVFLRRFTYAGDVRAALGQQHGGANTTITVRVRCSDPASSLGGLLGELFDGKTEFEFEIAPSYLTVDSTRTWISVKPPPSFQERLGFGGQDLDTVRSGFNILRLSTDEDYESLLKNKSGKVARDSRVGEYRTRLFPYLNGIELTIGRIPELRRCLPGGSRRVISANGVVTSHDLDLTRGRNQEYVRCFDMVIDVNAQLNYGKTQITNPHLVGAVRRYINEAYLATIQNAASRWVGKIVIEDDDDQTDIFFGRQDLELGTVLTKVPTSEQDVIALFFELAGRGVFPGYRVYGLSSKDRYDGRAAIIREGEDEEKVFTPERESDLRVIEFKHTAATIVGDLDKDQKDLKEMDLLIAWTEGTSALARYAFEDIEHSAFADKTPSRVFPGVTRYLYDNKSGRELQLLLLKDVADKLRAAEEGKGEAAPLSEE